MSDKKTIEERVADYEKIRQEASEFYNTFSHVDSPALGQIINFTAGGFNHLVYPSPKKMRDKRAQILRFDLLERAKTILETSTTYQEYDEEIIYKKVNRHGNWVQMNVLVKCWGFVAILSKFRVKVVVTQEGNGAITFLSVIPAWFTKWYGNIKLIETSVGKGLKNSSDLDNNEETLKNAAVSDVL